MGEKLEYYCSSSEDEENDSCDSDREEENVRNVDKSEGSCMTPEVNKWDGSSSNTGPKGVIRVNTVSRFHQYCLKWNLIISRKRFVLMEKNY